MASKTLIDVALKLYKGLGGNLSKVLGTRSNVNFLGKGKSSEMMVDMDINPEALGVLPQSKAVSELDSAMGYLTSNKLNDMQANKLISNMQKMKDFYSPPACRLTYQKLNNPLLSLILIRLLIVVTHLMLQR